MILFLDDFFRCFVVVVGDGGVVVWEREGGGCSGEESFGEILGSVGN